MEIHVEKHLVGHNALPFCLVHILPRNTFSLEDSEIYILRRIINDSQELLNNIV